MPVTLNLFGVASQGDKYVLLFAQRLTRPIAKADALNLAAWIVALADPEFDSSADVQSEFLQTLRAIKET